MSAHVALLTPMDRDQSVDFDALDQHLARMLDAGADGVVALGTMGEFPDLEGAEREAIVRAIVTRVAGTVPVSIGVGALGTREACDHARRAAGAGADRILALPPLYWKLGDDALVDHFGAIVDATDLPVMLYDIPFLAGTELSLGLIEALAREQPDVIGVKLSGADLSKVIAALRIKEWRPDFEVTIGHRELALPGLMMGADAVIGELINVVPELHAAFVHAIRDGQHARAIELNRQILVFAPLSALSAPPMLALKVATEVAGSPVQPVVRTWPARPDVVIERARTLAERLLKGDD